MHHYLFPGEETEAQSGSLAHALDVAGGSLAEILDLLASEPAMGLTVRLLCG